MRDVHESFGLSAFPQGAHNEARAAAKAHVGALKPRLGLIGLNPKIDSHNQRRLQCSVSLSGMVELFRERAGEHHLHDMIYGEIYVPLQIGGGEGERRLRGGD